jgi:hypothetical protein
MDRDRPASRRRADEVSTNRRAAVQTAHPMRRNPRRVAFGSCPTSQRIRNALRTSGGRFFCEGRCVERRYVDQPVLGDLEPPRDLRLRERSLAGHDRLTLSPGAGLDVRTPTGRKPAAARTRPARGCSLRFPRDKMRGRDSGPRSGDPRAAPKRVRRTARNSWTSARSPRGWPLRRGRDTQMRSSGRPRPRDRKRGKSAGSGRRRSSAGSSPTHLLDASHAQGKSDRAASRCVDGRLDGQR